jgi:asparagine synthase (glutamine-hydrolysing)
MGFSIPLDAWLRGPLRDWVEGLLGRDRLRRDGYFDVDLVRTTWQRHLDGELRGAHLVWTIVMFQLWLDRLRGA